VEDGTRRAVLAALGANLGIAAAKVVAALITNSASMLAEAIHSLADTGNQGLLFLGSRRAERPPDVEHPFGYGSERYFWAFVVAVVLFTLGSMFSLYEGVEKLRHPHQLESPTVAFVVLGIAAVLESLSLRNAVREASHRRRGLTWFHFIRRTKNPELSVVLLEDFAALIGIALAVTGLVLAVVTGEERFDAVGSIAIGILLAVIAAVLATEMKSLLIGESATSRVRDRLLAVINDAPEVRSLIHMRTLQLGPEDLLVAAKLDFVAPTTTELAPAIDSLEAQLRAAVPEARVIYLEPDLDRSRTEHR